MHTKYQSTTVKVTDERLINMSGLIYCQNPNLTSTQPNLTSTLVGFDMIITLHPPPPPHHPTRNSTSTRNNDPRGLKFRRQGQQA